MELHQLTQGIPVCTAHHGKAQQCRELCSGLTRLMRPSKTALRQLIWLLGSGL